MEAPADRFVLVWDSLVVRIHVHAHGVWSQDLRSCARTSLILELSHYYFTLSTNLLVSRGIFNIWHSIEQKVRLGVERHRVLTMLCTVQGLLRTAYIITDKSQCLKGTKNLNGYHESYLITLKIIFTSFKQDK